MKKALHLAETAIANGFVAIFSITCIFPIIWMVYSSLKTDREFSLDILSLPQRPMFENYQKAVSEGNIGVYFINSMFNTVTVVCVVLVLVFVIGYCLSRFRFRGRTIIYYIFLSGMLIPIYALLIPIFVEFKALGLLNERYTLILPYIAFALPVGVFLVESFMTGIPTEIEEAACIDGSSFLNTMFVIVMPMCKPVLSTCAIITFLNTWNEFPLALVLIRSNALKTMPIGLTNFVGSYTVNYPLMLAALVVSTIPVIVMYLLFYNQIMKGMTDGAVKG